MSGNNNSNVNQNLHSPTKLTEFARNFDEEPETLFGRFFSRFQNVYNQSYNTVNDAPSSNPQSRPTFYANNNPSALSGNSPATSSSSRTNQQPPTQDALNLSAVIENPTSVSYAAASGSSSVQSVSPELPVEAKEGRTLPNVLRRLSNIVSARDHDLRNYKDTDLHRLWMPDAKAKDCFDCGLKFSTFRRKHHCRLCGQIFCSKCCNQVVPGKIIKCSGDLKVCKYCSTIVLNYLKSPNVKVDLHADLQALQEDLANKLETNPAAALTAGAEATRTNSMRKASLGYQEERFANELSFNLSFTDRKNILQQSNSLIALHGEMQRELPYQNCGLALIDFLNANNKSANKEQAIALLSAMLAAGFLQPIVPDAEQTEFDESLHYKFVELPSQNLQSAGAGSGEHISQAGAQLTRNSAEPQPPKPIEVPFTTSNEDLELDSSMRATSTTSKLLESYCDHEEQILMQLLYSSQLDTQWAKVLGPLCCRAANQLRPEYCTNELMDVRNYVNVKKVPGGKRTECAILGGIVFTKNVAHKDMAIRIERPRILLLQCPIVYERIEGKFVTLSTILLQEKEYLSNVCTRIMSFKPNVVLVHKNVAGTAQDLLRAEGVTLVLDVKLSVMERMARTFQCDILNSIESNIAQPRLGYCDVFEVRKFSDGKGACKTLMCFEKLTNPRGYTCLLRGGPLKELEKVKRIASFLVYARYNWRLELSFLLDEYAQPVAPKLSIFDSTEGSPENDDLHDQIKGEVDEEEFKPRISAVCTPKRVNLERKTEDKVLAAVSENVSDCSDPLRATHLQAQATSPSEQQQIMALAVETRYDNRFKTALSSVILSVSPFLTFPLPYLETEHGRKCKLRKLFPTELFFSRLWSNMPSSADRCEQLTGETRTQNDDKENEQRPAQSHKFLRMKITGPITNLEVQTELAHFRAAFCRYPKKKQLMTASDSTETFQHAQKACDEHIYQDALDIMNHQRIAVLFCSFYMNPKSASSFCSPPLLLDMKFYGQQDIMLEQFLKRYCCLLTSICPLCKLPMMGHVRRFVHSMGCVQIFLSEDRMKTDSNRIYLTSWCTICGAVTPTVPLSQESRCLSFAKYLELRFHGHAYKRRALDELENNCEHSLHRDYVHHFSYRGVGAKFQYTSIKSWEISLPPLQLQLHSPKPFNRFEVLEEIKNFSIRGHEVYTRIHESIANLAVEDESSPLVANLKATLSKDQFVFKQKMEIVQTLLAETKATPYDISDALTMAKRALADSIELWSPRLSDIATAQKLAAKQPHHIDPGTICTEELRPDLNNSASSVDFEQISAQCDQINSAVADHIWEDNTNAANAVYEENRVSVDQLLAETTNSDKKTIRKILTQLLPSIAQVNQLQTPFTTNEHLTLPLGSFPILLRDNDLSSIIAYSLTSGEYQRLVPNVSSSQLPADTMSTHEGSNASPQLKRKSQESELDDNSNTSRSNHATSATTTANNEQEDRASKSSKTQNSHIEISLSDNGAQFTCKIYFAREFDLMRANTLKPPDVDNSLYRKLEKSKMREELKISQSRTGPEIELVRKQSIASNNGKHSNSESPPKKDDFGSIEECRDYFARSLSDSIQWEARGGKSGSRFCKTIDDRFVLKEMTKGDVSIFENFAPNYFEYISKCQQQNQPTLLAKIFGVFKVTIKTKEHFQEKSLLVMENLFYGTEITNKFDLKGSERNRLVDPANQTGDIVLLDENLVQMSWSQPLYILSHSKTVLKDAINRDTSFLERNEVMDYSLLVGLDKSSSTLILGIIDYIRTFTIDKKIESFVKQTGILGGMGKLPTIIPPEPYKQRFTDAMNRYFFPVPDRWEGLSKV